MRSIKILLLVLAASGLSLAQGSYVAFPVQTPLGVAIPGASVALCSSLPTTATPCGATSIQPTFTDITLGTQCAQNPATLGPLYGAGCTNPGLTDGNGMVHLYATANPAGVYYTQAYGQSIQVPDIEPAFFPGPASNNLSSPGPIGNVLPNTGLFKVLNGAYIVDGINYPLTSTGINAALAAACNGTIPGVVELKLSGSSIVTGISGQISVPSNCTLQKPGRESLMLQVSAGYNTNPLILISGATNVRLEGFGIDANRTANSNVFDLIEVTNSSNVTLDQMLITNSIDAGINLFGSNSNITISNSVITNNGAVLPSPNGGGIGITPSSGLVTNVSMFRNYIHGNNHGIAIFNSSTVASTVAGVDISENIIEGNANDGIEVTSSFVVGGEIRGVRVANNKSNCNGYLSAGLPNICTADFLQNGGSNSSSGVGIDFTGPLIREPIVVGNDVDGNAFDGVSLDTEIIATVNTSGSTITCSGCGSTYPALNTRWQTGQWVQVNGTPYQISSCASTTSCTTVTSIGSNTGATLRAPSLTYAAITGNTAVKNHNTGFFNSYSDGNKFTGNTAAVNGLEGFGDADSTGIGFSNNTAYSNDTQNSGSNNAGFVISETFDTMIAGGNFTADYQSFQTQNAGVLNTSAAVNTYIVGNKLTGPSANISDAGTGTTYDNDGRALGAITLAAQTANISATTVYATRAGTSWGAAGIYRVCASGWITATGSGTMTINAIAPSGAGTVTIPIGTTLNPAALTNGGGGCTMVHAAASSNIQVSVTGYSSGTYSLQATVEYVQSN